MKKNIISAVLAATAMLVGANVSAQDLKMSYYLGASGGVTTWNIECYGSTSCEKNPSSLRIFGGLNITPNLAVELTYAALGTAKVNSTGSNLEIQGRSFDLSGVYKFPVPTTSSLQPFVKGGLAYTNAKASATSSINSGTSTQQAWGLLIGAGVIYTVTESFALRAEVNTQNLKVPGSSGNVTSFSVGGQAMF